MKAGRILKKITAAVLCLAMCMQSIPAQALPVPAADITLPDGTVIHSNLDGSKTATISVSPEKMVLLGESDEDRLREEGGFLVNEGEEADTKIRVHYEEGNDLVTIAKAAASISFRPVTGQKKEEEALPADENGIFQDSEPVKVPEPVEVLKEEQALDPETAEQEEIPLLESESVEQEETALPGSESVEQGETPVSEMESVEQEETALPETESGEVEETAVPETGRVEQEASEIETEADITQITDPVSEDADGQGTGVKEEVSGDWTEKEPEIQRQESRPQTEQQDMETEETEIHDQQSPGSNRIEEVTGSVTLESETADTEAEKAAVIAGKKEGYQNGTYESIKYENLFDGCTDVVLSARKGGVKEDIILKEYQGQPVYEYAFSFQGLVPEQNGKQILLKNTQGMVEAVVEAPFMTDADQAYSEEIEVELRHDGDGAYTVSYRPNDAWLKAEERVYPVTIDPTVTYTSDSPLHMEDNYVTAEEPDINHYFNEPFFKVGNDGTQTHMAYIRPVIPDSIKNISSRILIKDASVRMYEYSGRSSSQKFSLHRVTGGEWASRTITYQNAPVFTGKAYQSKEVNGGGWVEWDLKEMFSEWFNVLDQKENFGFALTADKGTHGDSRTFYSADSLDRGMTFSVTYFEDVEKPKIKAESKGNGANSGTGYVKLSWDKVQGAESYYVGIFNGKEYEYFFVGNQRTFSSKGKGIWPTQKEIKKGRYALHADGKGTEFPMIPAFTYANVKNGDYGDSLKYYFKILPCNVYGQAVDPGFAGSKTIKMPDTMPPNQAAAVTASPSGFTNTSKMAISWSGVTDFGTTSATVVNTLGKGNIQYSTDGTADWKDTGINTASGSYTFDTSVLKDGTHSVYIRGKDAAGNTGTPKGGSFYIDRTGPAKPVLDLVPKGWSSQTSVSVSWSGLADLNPLHRVEYAIDNSPWTSTTISEKVYQGYQIPISPLTDGSHTLKVRGVDTLGNTGTVEGAVFYKDTKPPMVEAVTLQPDAWSKEDRLTVTWRGAGDAGSGLGGISYAVDDGAYQELGTVSRDGSFTEELNGLEDGAHEITVLFEDQTGNRLKKEYPFYRDTKAPELALTAPASGDLVNGNLEVWGSVQDISLKGWEIQAQGLTSGKAVSITGSAPANQERIGILNTGAFLDGESITLTLSAEDEAGIRSEVTGIVVKADKSAKPLTGEVQITEPKQGAVIQKPQENGSYARQYPEPEAEGYAYIDGVFQGRTTGSTFHFDAIRYPENSLHSISVISRGESGRIYYSGGLAAFMLMSESFDGKEQEVHTTMTRTMESPKEILALRLHVTEEAEEGTSINYFYSVDEGKHWEPIESGTDVPLMQESRRVMLRAVPRGDSSRMPRLMGWELEGVIEMSPVRAVSRLMADTRKLTLPKTDKITAAAAKINLTPLLPDAAGKWLFTDDTLHQDAWNYDALSAKEKSTHKIAAMAQAADGTMYGTGTAYTELLLRESFPDEGLDGSAAGRSRKVVSKTNLQSIRLSTLTNTGEGRYFYSIDEKAWSEIRTDEQMLLEKASDTIYLKAELPAGTRLQAWHMEGIHITGRSVSVQLLDNPLQVTAADYGKVYQDAHTKRYEITWKDPNGAQKGKNYDTRYHLYRNDRYLGSSGKPSFTDRDYYTDASYEVEIERIYEKPDELHTHYLTRRTDRIKAVKNVLPPEKEVDAVRIDVEEQKQSEALDKLYGGGYTFSDKKKAPAGEAALNQRLLGKSNYCAAGFEPINFNTGNFYLEAGDYSSKDMGETVLEIFRTYNAQSAADNGPFGAKWEFDYGQHLVFYQEGDIGYREADGKLLIFKPGKDGSFQGEDSAGPVLSGNRAGTSYLITQTDGTAYHFSASGLLKSIKKGKNRIRLERDEQGKLTGIKAPSGRSLTVEMDEKGHIVKIITPSKAEMTYTYKGDQLVSFTDLNGNKTRYVYDGQNRMTTWYDGKGNRQVYNQYDEKNRVVYQEDAKKGQYTLEYFKDHTVTTDAEGGKYEVHFDVQKRSIKEIDANGNEILYAYNEAGCLAGRTNKSGQLTTYKYDESGNCIKETAPDGAVTTMKYDRNSRVTEVTDPNGYATTYRYDRQGNRIRQKNPDGSILAYQYNKQGQLVKEINESSYATTYRYNRNGQLIRKTDPLGNRTSYQYDKEGNCQAETDALGQKTKYKYDAGGNLTKIIYPDGTFVAYTYDVFGNALSCKDPNGNITTYQYDALSNQIQKTVAGNPLETTEYSGNNLPLTVTNGLGETTSYQYDKNGNRTEKKDALGNVTKYRYDREDRLVKEILPTGAKITYRYDKVSGRLTSSMDQMGIKTDFQYDKGGNLIKKTMGNGSTVTMAYDSCNRLVKEVNESGGVTVYRYNKAGQLEETTGPLGGKTVYKYDKNGTIIRVTNALGGNREMKYDGLGRLTQMKDELGAVTAYAYDSVGNLLSQTDGLGNQYTFSYDANGNKVTSANPLGNTMEYCYDGNNSLTSITKENGGKSVYEYNGAGQVVKETDVLGNSTCYTYNQAGQVVKETDALGQCVSYAYDPLGNRKKIELEGGGTVTYETDVRGNVICTTDELGLQTKLAYDSMGNITETSTDGRSTAYTYNKANQIASITDPDGNTLNYVYNKAGQPCAVIYPDGSRDVTEYDKLGRMVKEIPREGLETSYRYDAAGNLTAMTYGEKTTAYEYDILGRLVRTIYPDGSGNIYEYDGAGNIIREKDASGHETVYTYDRQSRMETLTQPNGAVKSWERDLAGRVTAETNGEGHTVKYAYDALGRLTGVTDPQGGKTRYAYGALDKVTRVTDALGRSTAYTYNAKGNVLSEQDALGNTVSYTYTSQGWLVKKTKADGSEINFTYDGAGRILAENHTGGEQITNSYNESGRLITAKDAGGETRYQYDADGNITSVTTPDQKTVTYTYDAYGRKSGLTYPDGKQVAYTYDRMDRLKTVTGLDGTVTSYEYDKSGRRIRTSGGHLETVFGYDAAGNLLTQKTTGETNLEFVYTYDKNNQITSEERKSKTGKVKSGFAYDSCGQLTEYSRSDGYRETYAYDQVGNMTLKRTDGEKTAMAYNQLNQLEKMTGQNGSIHYIYNANGSLVEKQLGGQKDVYTYNGAEQLVKLAGYDGYEKEYSYDARGMLRAAKEKGNTSRKTLEEIIRGTEERLAGENTGPEEGNSGEITLSEAAKNTGGDGWVSTAYTNDVTAENYEVLTETRNGTSTSYEYGLERTSAYTAGAGPGTKTDYAYDGRGNVAQSLTGTESRSQDYTPFGEVLTGGNASGYGYKGEAWDAAAKSVNLRARQYEPFMNQFSQKDRMRGLLSEPATLNPYTFVKNDPVNYSDPSGMFYLGQRYPVPQFTKEETETFKQHPNAPYSPETYKAYQYSNAYYSAGGAKAPYIPGYSPGYYTGSTYDTGYAARSAASMAAAAAQQRKDEALDVIKKAAGNGGTKISPEAKKIIDSYAAKLEKLRKEGKLTEQEAGRLISEACKKIDKAEKQEGKKKEAADLKYHKSGMPMVTVPASVGVGGVLKWAAAMGLTQYAVPVLAVCGGVVLLIKGGEIIYRATREELPTSRAGAIKKGHGIYYDEASGEIATVEGLGPEDMAGYDEKVKDKVEGTRGANEGKTKNRETTQGKSRAPKQGDPNSTYEQLDNETGEVVSRTKYDESGRPVEREDYYRGSENNKHEHYDKKTKENLKDHKHVYKYNDKGQRISDKVVPLPK